MIWISFHYITKEEEKNSNNYRIYAFYGPSNQLCGEAAWWSLDSSHLRPAIQICHFQMAPRRCSDWMDRRGFLQICSPGMSHYCKSITQCQFDCIVRGRTLLHALLFCNSKTHHSQMQHWGIIVNKQCWTNILPEIGPQDLGMKLKTYWITRWLKWRIWWVCFNLKEYIPLTLPSSLWVHNSTHDSNDTKQQKTSQFNIISEVKIPPHVTILGKGKFWEDIKWYRGDFSSLEGREQ